MLSFWHSGLTPEEVLLIPEYSRPFSPRSLFFNHHLPPRHPHGHHTLDYWCPSQFLSPCSAILLTFVPSLSLSLLPLRDLLSIYNPNPTHASNHFSELITVNCPSLTFIPITFCSLCKDKAPHSMSWFTVYSSVFPTGPRTCQGQESYHIFFPSI